MPKTEFRKSRLLLRIALITLLVIGAAWYFVEGRKHPAVRLLDEYRALSEGTAFARFGKYLSDRGLGYLAGLFESRSRWHGDIQHDLQQLGASAIPYLGEALQSGSGNMNLMAVLVLANSGHDDAIPFLLEAARNSRDDNVRLGALMGLGAFARPAFVPVLKTIFEKDGNTSVRNRAVEIMGRIDDEEARSFLLELLSDHDQTQVRETAATALAPQHDQPLVIEALFKAVESDPNDLVRIAAIRSLPFRGVVKRLHHRLGVDASWEVRSCIAERLAAIGDPASGPVLAQRLHQEPEEVVRLSIAYALLRFGISGTLPQECMETLHDVALHDPFSSVRIRLAQTIGKRRDPSNVQVLKRIAAGDPDPEVRKNAEAVLRTMK